MKKRVIFFATFFLLANFGYSQFETLPPNPEPGKCYIRSVSQPIYETQEQRILVRPAYKIFEKIPAEYRIVEERVLIKPAHQQLIVVPAEFRTVTKQIELEPLTTEITTVLPLFVETLDSIQTRPKIGGWEYETSPENCPTPDPRDCMVLRYVERPAVFKTFRKTTIEQEASYVGKPRSGQFGTITVQELVREAYTKTVEVPAEYTTITRRELVRDETVREIEVPAEYRVETVEILKSKGGEISWEEIDCALTEFNILPVLYEFNSARLTPESQDVIDNGLLKLMRDKPNIRVEISAHTDSRGAAADNLKLSQARAEAVADYLISRGIQRNRMIAKGYGESRLKNRCADGIYCSEAEHAQNRRTEFRVLSN